jgi:hypothetical protein
MSGHLLVADVVSSCPPMFDPSHHGCRFAPSMTEIIVAGGLLLFAVAIAVMVLVGRKRHDGV